MPRRRRNAAARSTVLVRRWGTARTLKALGSFALALPVASLLILVPAASTARTPLPLAAQTTAQLQVIVTGAGNTPAVNVSAGPQCTITQTRDDGQSCLYTVMEGQDVTLSPVDPTGFVGWSVFECPGTGACTINVDSDRTVVATFSPTTLTVIVEGALPDPQSFGRVTSLDGKIDCSGPPTQTCVDTTFQAFAEVTLTAEPAADFEKWSGACQGPDEALPTCTLVLSGDDVVGAKFKNNTDPEIIPPRQQAQLRVSVEPQGAGTITSSRSRLSEAINCSPTCKARFEQGERPTLTATGPSFVGWVGGGNYCTSKPTCRYPAFRTTSIKAVFKAPPPPPPPPPHHRRLPRLCRLCPALASVNRSEPRAPTGSTAGAAETRSSVEAETIAFAASPATTASTVGRATTR